MFALRQRKDQEHVEGASYERVLPFALRKPYRFFSRLIAGHVRAPRYAGIMGTVLFFCATGVYGMVAGGHTHHFFQTTTYHLGFSISDIRISGQKQTSELEILRALDLQNNTSLVSFDTDSARQKLLLLPWVQSVEIIKNYPQGLSIKLKERVAFAIWQDQEDLSLIEEDGHVIVPFAHQEFAHLPLVTGADANKNAASLVRAVASVPMLKNRVKAQMFIAKRRWDLRLDNGVTIKLPEGEIGSFLTNLAHLDDKSNILSKGIVSVDLRVKDRMIVRLSDDAKVERDARIAAQNKAIKSGEKNI